MNDKGVNPLEQNIKRLCKTYDITDESAINFLNSIHDGSIQLKDGQTILQGYQTYLKSTSKSLTLADLKTKALSASQIKGFGLKNKKYSINIIAYSDIHGVLLYSNIIWEDVIKLI